MSYIYFSYYFHFKILPQTEMEENNQDFFHTGGDYLKLENEEFPQDAEHNQMHVPQQTGFISDNQIDQDSGNQAFQLQQDFWKNMAPLMGINHFNSQSTRIQGAGNITNAPDPMMFAMQSMVNKIVSYKDQQVIKQDKNCDFTTQGIPWHENIFIQSNDDALQSVIKQEPNGTNEESANVANTGFPNFKLKVKLKSTNESKEDRNIMFGLDDIKTENNTESDVESYDSDKTIGDEEYATQFDIGSDVKGENIGKP